MSRDAYYISAVLAAFCVLQVLIFRDLLLQQKHPTVVSTREEHQSPPSNAVALKQPAGSPEIATGGNDLNQKSQEYERLLIEYNKAFSELKIRYGNNIERKEQEDRQMLKALRNNPEQRLEIYRAILSQRESAFKWGNEVLEGRIQQLELSVKAMESKYKVKVHKRQSLEEFNEEYAKEWEKSSRRFLEEVRSILLR